MKLFQYALIFLLFFNGFQAYSQGDSSKNRNSKTVNYTNIEAPFSAKEMKWLKEVYAGNLNELVLNKPQRVKDIKHLLRNRIEIKKINNPFDVKESTLLSTVPLFLNYNNNLKKEQTFNTSTFNPLKYKFNFYSKGEHFYQVDNTSYYIIIRSQFR